MQMENLENSEETYSGFNSFNPDGSNITPPGIKEAFARSSEITTSFDMERQGDTTKPRVMAGGNPPVEEAPSSDEDGLMGWTPNNSLDSGADADISAAETEMEENVAPLSDWQEFSGDLLDSQVIVPYPGRRMRSVNDDAPPGFEIDLRYEPNYAYTAIEVITWDPWFEATRPFFPTQWLHRTNPYWNDVQEMPPQYRDGQPYEIISRVDGCPMEFRAFPNGEIIVKRNGVTVVVAYEDGGNGGYPQPERLEEVVPDRYVAPRPRENIVDTLSIPRECPYWSELLSGLVSPDIGKTKWVRSEFDGTKCQVLLENDGRVYVRRDNKQVEIVGGYEQ